MDNLGLLILALALGFMAIVAVGYVLYRRYHTPHSIEPRSKDALTEIAPVEPTTSAIPSTEQRAISETITPEVVPAIPHVPQTPLPTSPDASVPVTLETSPGEDATIAAKPEEVQSVPFPQLLVSTSPKDRFEPPDASLYQQPVTESRAPASLPVAYAPASTSRTEFGITNDEFIESDDLEGTAAATPLPHLAVESDVQETPKPPLSETELTPKPPTYHPLTPPSPRRRISDVREQTPRVLQKADADLRLRVQLVLGHGGTVKTLALIPDRREGMPGGVEVIGRRGESRLSELLDDCYEPVLLIDASDVLREGIDWRGCGDARRWRWVLGGRELYVLAPGDEFGLHGFVSTARLRLNTRHVILATAALRDQVLTALADAGCAAPDVNGDNTPGVPSGWILFRNVTPTRAVPMREEADILNALCPAHEIEPHFVGGIRLERNTWLVGFPPRIRFTGELGDGFQVMIDGALARLATDDAFEAPGWDVEGEHHLWFADQTVTYSLRTMNEGWGRWTAHDFGTGVGICGASIHQIDGMHWHQARAPATNPLLIGSRPGEVFKCQARHGVRSATIFALVPFAPVWALPIDTLHADKRSAHLVLLNAMEPASTTRHAYGNRNEDRALREWVVAINDARRKQLALADEDARVLWQRYCVVAKRLWKRMR